MIAIVVNHRALFPYGTIQSVEEFYPPSVVQSRGVISIPDGAFYFGY